jgi:hypothetical protein
MLYKILEAYQVNLTRRIRTSHYIKPVQNMKLYYVRQKLGCAVAQAVSRWVSHRGGPGSNPGLVMWDL